MKKLLLSFFMCMLAIIGMQAAEATLSSSEAEGQGTSNTGGEITISKQPITFSFNKAYGASGHIKAYSGCKIQITGATITKVVITATSSSYIKTWTSSDDSNVEISGSTATWTGSSNDITLTNTASAQARISSIVVTYETAGEGGGEDPEQPGEGGGEEPETPVNPVEGETVTFDATAQGYENGQSITSVTIASGITATFDQGSNSNAPKYYTTGTAIRCYGGNNFTITSAVGNITKVVLTYGSSDGSNAITTDCGTFSTNTWTGESTSVMFTIGGTTGNRRIQEIAVTYVVEEGVVLPPAFEPADGTKFNTELTVALTANEGAIKYSTDGVNFVDYTQPFVITQTTTISAKVVCDDKESSVVTATYTKRISFDNIAAVVSANNTTDEFFINGAVTVTYDAGSDLYVTDETGSILLYGTSGTYENGMKLTGVIGMYKEYNGLPEITNATLPEAVAGDAVEPVVMTAEEVKALTAKDYSRYIKLENVEVTASTIAGITLYNKYNIELKKGTDCTVVGIVGYFNEALQIYPISIEVNESGEDPVDPTPDPTEPVYGWVLVKDASTLAVGDKVVIAAADSDKALSTTQNNNNRVAATITKSGNTITFDDDTQIITLEQGTVEGSWAFNTGSGYLYAASSSANHLKTQKTNNDNGIWNITIANDGKASIVATQSNNRNVMQYNSSSSLFACYSSASQAALALYRYCDANITAGMYYLVPGKWENEDLALYGVKFVNVSTGEYKWVQGFLNNHYVYFQLDGEGEYTHMAFYRIANTGETTTTVITEWDAIEVLDKTPELTYTAPANGKIMRYIVDESKWEEVEIGSGVNRVEMAGGIGYAYGVVSAEGAIEVYNVNGAVVARGNDTIDLRGLGRGVYIIRNGNQVRKVVR